MLRSLMLTMTLAITLTCACPAETQVKTNVGTLSIEDSGEWTLQPAGGKGAFSGTIGLYAPGWRYTGLAKANDHEMSHEAGSNQWIWKGTIAEPKSAQSLSYEVTLTVSDGLPSFTYAVTPSGEIPFQSHSRGLFLSLNLPENTYTDQMVRTGSNTYKLPANNAWSYGNNITLDPANAAIKVDHGGSVSLWDRRKYGGNHQIRIYLQGNKSEDRKKIVGSHNIAIHLLKQQTPLDPKTAISIQDRWVNSIEDYRRILQLPRWPGIHTDTPLGWLAEASKAAKESKTAPALIEKVKHVEDWLDLHTQLTDIADQLHHLNIFSRTMNTEVPGAITSGYTAAIAALNEGRISDGLEQSDSLRKALRQAEKDTIKTHGSSFRPVRSANPQGFLKAMNLAGYAWQTGGLVPPDPRPWDIHWQGGQTLSLVETPKHTMGACNWATERSWVSTVWIHNDARYTFSVLTPLVLVEHVDTLPLSNTAGQITQITYREKNGKPETLSITDDFDSTDSPLPMAANWLILTGPDTALLVFVGQAPMVMKTSDRGLALHFPKDTWAAVMPANPKNAADDIQALAQQWSRIAVAPPVEVMELQANGQATYRYVYREQPDAFNTKAQYIAPLPGLYIQANALPADAIQQKLAGGEMTYAYLPGKAWTADIKAPKVLLRRGINEYANRLTDNRLDTLASQGVDWVRVLGNRHRFNKAPEAQYAAFEQALTGLKQRGIKALVDPHDFLFAVHRKHGIPEDPDKRRVFTELWRRLATIGSKYPDTVVGYDLYNELRIGINQWPAWKELAEEAITVVRSIDPDTTIYISGTDMSNPTGYTAAEPLAHDNLIYSFHFYAPHAFSHQKVMVSSEYDSFVFYPGWVPQIDWKAKELYGSAPPRWWDRWMIGASMYQVLSFMARNNVPMHCGEVAPIGYSKPKAAESARLWTRDSLDWLERHHISWNLWNQGFGLTIDEVADEVIPRWNDNLNQ